MFDQCMYTLYPLQVRPDDVLAANRAGSPAAAAAVATGATPVVKFVPKRVSLWGAPNVALPLLCVAWAVVLLL
jgi:hypothetical protein